MSCPKIVHTVKAYCECADTIINTEFQFKESRCEPTKLWQHLSTINTDCECSFFVKDECGRTTGYDRKWTYRNKSIVL